MPLRSLALLDDEDALRRLFGQAGRAALLDDEDALRGPFGQAGRAPYSTTISTGMLPRVALE
ncbi:hypothetical protein ACFVYF_37025 [Streptomyces sp. NPDC058274]|uniref:hypothetical protein n=1 Tax=Streptomyces sp. NPDC058274 TaxID=3346416 RepID=UPI0036E69C99